MKQFICILVLLVINQTTYSQVNTEYTIYLMFNSQEQEMNVIEKKISDTVHIKTFNFVKDMAAENYKYAISIGENGKLKKGKGSILNKKNKKIRLYHYSYKHSEQKISELSNINIIDYESFINAEFKSFNEVLKKANKIFIIDTAQQKDESSSYMAYEVDF